MENVVVSNKSFARLTRKAVIQSSGLVPVVSTNRRLKVRLLMRARFASCATVIGSCSLSRTQSSRCESQGLASSPTGLSINCACPPSRCGETTSPHLLDSPSTAKNDECYRVWARQVTWRLCIHREQLLHGPEQAITPKMALLRGSPHHSRPEKLRPDENPLLGAVFSIPAHFVLCRQSQQAC